MQTTDDYWNVTSWLDYEALTQPTRLINSAKRSKYSCNTHPTSIEHTVFSSDNNNKEKNKLVISLSPIISTSNSNNNKRWPATLDFIPIYIQFHAYNNQSQPQTYGGDVFVIEYQSWSSSVLLPNNTTNATISIKNAAYTIDGLDGSYSAVLFIPRQRHLMTYLNVTLRHYYTCHTGLKIPQEVQSTSGITLARNFGPLVWTQLRDAILDISQEQRELVDDEQLIIHNSRPTCTNFNEATFGIWQEENIHYPSELSMKEAEWYPIYCNLADTYGKVQPKQQMNPGKALRIGDSTTPYRIAEVGYPFSIPHTSQPKYHELWYADALWNMLHNDTFTTLDDTMYYQAGLHHLLHYNYNPQSIAKLMMKAVCQIGLVFSRNGKPIVVQGPNPIQQHLNDKVDQTALNAQMINWYIRSLLVRYEYKLQNICEDLIHLDKISISSLVNVADEKNGGTIMSNEDTISLLQKEYNFTTTEYYNDTNQVALSNYLHDLTRNDRIRLYRNRTIRWINTESYLLPRHERYRGGPPPTDKVHGHVEFMFFAEHWLYLKLEKMARSI